MTLSATDRKILNVLQARFPLVSAPFQAIGDEMGMTEQEVLQSVRRAKDEGVLRQVSAIFDTRRLGYKSILVAVQAEKERLDEVADIFNRHPGVSHNYGRTHGFNLWFTLAVQPDDDLQETLDQMMAEARVDKMRLLPTLQFFKIGVNFDVENYTNTSNAEEGTATVDASLEPITVSEFDKQVIRELQEDLPLEPRPFAAMATRLGIPEQELFDAAGDLQERGAMRRFSAVLHHREAGFRANAMICWQVPEERALEVGQTLAANSAVSHCYQRPTFPDWPYSHFSMVHARKRSECLELVNQISEDTGIDDYVILMSTKEYKKTRVRYFVEDDWKRNAPPTPTTPAGVS